VFGNPDRSHAGIPVFNPTTTHASAPVYRSATALFMSYVRNQSVVVQRMYLEKYYHAARKCIEHSAVPELIYASYLVAAYSLIGGESISEATQKTGMFAHGALLLIRQGSIQGDELLWIENLWQNLVMALYYIHHETVVRRGGAMGRRSADSFVQLERLLDNCSPFLPSDIDVATVPVSMPLAAVCVKVTSLAIYLQFYFDYFLFARSSRNEAMQTNTTRLRDVLASILGRICQLISHLPNIPDAIYESYRRVKGDSDSDLTGSSSLPSDRLGNVALRGMNSARQPKISDGALTLLYCFSQLLLNLQNPSSSPDSTIQPDIGRSAVALGRVCSSLECGDFKPEKTVGLLIKRSLFWAGLFTRATHLRKGTLRTSQSFVSSNVVNEWIMQHLKSYFHLGFYWRLPGFADEESLVHRFFLQAEFGSSHDDVWSASVDGVSLFDYSLTLAPWFVAFFSIRFDVHSDGSRSIRMI